MPIIMKKHQMGQRELLRDTRPASVRFMEALRKPDAGAMLCFVMGGAYILAFDVVAPASDILVFFALLYLRWLFKKAMTLPFKIPRLCQLPRSQ